jgi:CBS domain-containing protein
VVRRTASWLAHYSGDTQGAGEGKAETKPDFEGAYIDGLIEFVPAKEPLVAHVHSPANSEVLTPSPEAQPDPTYRIGKLHSANRAPVSVNPNQTIKEAVTLMLANDFSQLPVMVSERDVKGIISWTSVGRGLALGGKRNDAEARECMDPAHIVSADTSLFDAIDEIVRNQYVLIQDLSRKISGIVTTSDLSLQFHQMTEPFLLLGEIENHVRNIIVERGRFTKEVLRKFSNPNDPKPIDGVSDLSFGEYIGLLENEECWASVGLAVDRKIFVRNLDKVRRIRNDVMHFDPDGVSDDDLEALRKFTAFLQRLQITLTPASKD